MGLILEKIRWKNLLSYGNNWSEYIFKIGVTKISGINGQGKSCLVDAIYFVFFGKPYRKINIPNIVNSINKSDLKVELYFSSNSHNYKIIRGLKPNIFEIWKDEELIDQNNTKSGYQGFLNEEIFHFNEEIFQQIGIKSLTRFNSYSTMSKSKKREIIENIFELGVLSEMRELNKIEMDDTSQEIYLLKKDENKYEMLIEQETRNLEKLKQLKVKLEKDIEEKNDAKKEEVESLKEQIDKLKKGFEKIRIEEIKKKSFEKSLKLEKGIVQKIKKEKDKIKIEISVFDSKIDFLRTSCGDCPKIKEIIKNSPSLDLNKKLVDKNNEIEKKQNFINDTLEFIEICNKLIQKKGILENTINNKKKEIQKIKNSFEKIISGVVIDESKYKDYKFKLEKVIEKIYKKNDSLKYFDVIFTLLKDDGIKSYIIKKYLPLLNKLVNTYLQKFSMDLELVFNTDMDIEIRTKFKENYSFENFSEGEKKRINSSILFTFLEFCKLKHSNSNINILILDEFSSGLDISGENILFEILKDISEKNNSEIITISQNPLIDPEKINNLYEVKMEKGFSVMELIKDE